MDRVPARRRLRRVARDWATTIGAATEPAYRRLSRGYALPDGIERVYCHHVRKTAGTSLHFSFLALGGEEPSEVQRRIERSSLHRTISGRYAFVAHQRRLLDEGHYFYGWSHLPARRLSLRPGTFTVTILRDPVDRVVSYYRYLVEGDDASMAFAVRDYERALARRGFSEFLDEVPPMHLLAQLFTFSKALDVSEARDEISKCSFVMMTEDYESGLSELSARLELPLVAHRERSTSTRVDVSESDRRRLREMLEPEYALIEELERAGTLGSH